MIAHFSDVHIGHEDPARELAAFLALVDDAIARGAEHLVFGGDMVDHANLTDARALKAELDARGFGSSDRLSVVPGNHDVWPYGERNLRGDVIRAVLSFGAFGRARTDGAFHAIFASTFEGVATPATCGLPYPCTKQVGDLLLALVDSTSQDWRAPVRGRFPDTSWLEDELAAHHGPRLLVMHHPPIGGSRSRIWVERLVPRAVRLVADALRLRIEDFADALMADVHEVERFLAEAPLDAVLCGHFHHGFQRAIAGVPVHCLGASGGMHQGPRPMHAYHLVRPTRRGVHVETVRVPRSRLWISGDYR